MSTDGNHMPFHNHMAAIKFLKIYVLSIKGKCNYVNFYTFICTRLFNNFSILCLIKNEEHIL
jgi:hypothetical protein